jgi:DNA-binding SARP family transcriptional activator
LEGEHTPAIQLSLLRGFELHVAQRPVALVSSAQRLVAFLALRDKPLSRAHVAGMLWPETTTSRANANLRSSLWRAQRACRQLITASARHLVLTPGVGVDVRSAIAYAQRLLGHTANLNDTVPWSDLAADLLPDWYDDWALLDSERYHHLRLHALEALCEQLTAAARYGEAIDTGLAAVRAEPLRESAHQVLIKAHLAEGNRWEAFRQYERCRRLLLDELGLEPSSALHALLPVPEWSPAVPPRPDELATCAGTTPRRGRVAAIPGVLGAAAPVWRESTQASR